MPPHNGFLWILGLKITMIAPSRGSPQSHMVRGSTVWEGKNLFTANFINMGFWSIMLKYYLKFWEQ